MSKRLCSTFLSFFLILVLAACATEEEVRETFIKQNKATQQIIVESMDATMNGDEKCQKKLGTSETRLNEACRPLQKESVRRMNGEDGSNFWTFGWVDILFSNSICNNIAESILKGVCKKKEQVSGTK